MTRFTLNVSRFTLPLLLLAVLTMGASYDHREIQQSPVARVQFTRLSWVTGAGHAAQTATAAVNGTITRIDLVASAVTGNPTLNVSYADDNGVVLLPAMNSLADGTKHFKNALVNSISASADFNPVMHAGNITVTVDPSADAGGSAQTLTVDVILYIR